jgi:hypothetical protein
MERVAFYIDGFNLVDFELSKILGSLQEFQGRF